jgi:hypothetical protein
MTVGGQLQKFGRDASGLGKMWEEVLREKCQMPGRGLADDFDGSIEMVDTRPCGKE